MRSHQSLFILVRIGVVGGTGIGAGGKGVGTLDEPAQGEEGAASEDGGAPGLGVPPAVLAYSEPPLVPQRSRVGQRRVRRVRVPAAPRASAEPADAGDSLGRRWLGRRRRRWRRRDGLLLARHSKRDLCTVWDPEAWVRQPAATVCLCDGGRRSVSRDRSPEVKGRGGAPRVPAREGGPEEEEW